MRVYKTMNKIPFYFLLLILKQIDNKNYIILLTLIIFSDKIVRLSTVSSYGTLLFMTPVGQSYSCQKEISVVLSDQNVPTMKGYVLLRAFTVQPFIFKNNEFGPGKCGS